MWCLGSLSVSIYGAFISVRLFNFSFTVKCKQLGSAGSPTMYTLLVGINLDLVEHNIKAIESLLKNCHCYSVVQVPNPAYQITATPNVLLYILLLLTINPHRVIGDLPAHTDPNRRIYYDVIDVVKEAKGLTQEWKRRMNTVHGLTNNLMAEANRDR